MTHDVAAYNLWKAGRLAEAVPEAEAAVVGADRCLPSHGLLALLLLQLGRPNEAEAIVSQAEVLPGGGADAYDGLAHVCMSMGAHERGNHLYRLAAEASPSDPRFLYNLACSERSFGRLSDAAVLLDRAIAIDPGQYNCYLLRAELQVQTQSTNHVAELESLLAGRSSDPRAKIFLGYALGKELDDLGEFDRAFSAFQAAARARRSRLQYDVGADEVKLRRIAEIFGSKDVEQRADRENSARFIFVVGLPRSGTTLVERILSGLERVRSNGETNNFVRSLLAETPGAPADPFARAAQADPAAVAARYAALADLTKSNEKIVEKLPMNYLYLGAIRRALPCASIVSVHRTPIDSCFAMYRTLFGEAYPFSYDLRELARYFKAYARLMKHWGATVEGIHYVSYEDLVANPSRVGDSMAAACALPWDEAALDIQRNHAVSLTASASQVRRPIYGTSSGRWRQYEAHLSSLMEDLDGA